MTSQSSSSGSSSDSSDSEKDGATSGDSDQPLKAPTPKSTRKPRTKASKVRENTFGPFGVCVIKSAYFILCASWTSATWLMCTNFRFSFFVKFGSEFLFEVLFF